MIVIYNKKIDTLIVYFQKNLPAVSSHIEDGFWLRLDPQTSAPIGFEIEDFKKVFLKKHINKVKS